MNDQRQRLENVISKIWPTVTGQQANELVTALTEYIREDETFQQAFTHTQQQRQDQPGSRR